MWAPAPAQGEMAAPLIWPAHPLVLPRWPTGTSHSSVPVEHTATNLEVTPLWQALYDAGADVVIGGHDHNYERFRTAKILRASLIPYTAIREFVIGTGGKNLRPFGPTKPNSEVRK